MKRFLQIITSPFPLQDDSRTQMVYNLFTSLMVVAALIIIKPFGLDDVNLQLVKLVGVYFSFGLVTFLFCFLADRLVKPAFPDFFEEQKWNVGKNIIWIIFLVLFVGTGNLFLSNALGFTGVSGSLLLSFHFYLLYFTLIPAIVITLAVQIILQQKNKKTAIRFNEILIHPVSDNLPSGSLEFPSYDSRDRLKLSHEQFLFAEAADNYTDIVFVDNHIVKRALIENTIRQLSEINSSKFIIKTHRNYLVNLAKVKSVSGNAQGFRLGFENLDESVPLSERMASRIELLLKQMYNLNGRP